MMYRMVLGEGHNSANTMSCSSGRIFSKAAKMILPTPGGMGKDSKGRSNPFTRVFNPIVRSSGVHVSSFVLFVPFSPFSSIFLSFPLGFGFLHFSKVEGKGVSRSSTTNNSNNIDSGFRCQQNNEGDLHFFLEVVYYGYGHYRDGRSYGSSCVFRSNLLGGLPEGKEVGMNGQWATETGDTPVLAWRRGVRDALYLSLTWEGAVDWAEHMRPPVYIINGRLNIRNAYTAGLRVGKTMANM